MKFVFVLRLYMKVKSDHRSKFSNLSNWKEGAWKYQDFNGSRTCDLRDTGAMLDQLSSGATHWKGGQFVFTALEDMNSTNWPRSQCVAQLVEHRTGVTEVTGSNPVKALIFSGFFLLISINLNFKETIVYINFNNRNRKLLLVIFF